MVTFQQQIITNAAAKSQVDDDLEERRKQLLAHHVYPLVEVETHAKRRLVARVPTCGSREAISWERVAWDPIKPKRQRVA